MASSARDGRPRSSRPLEEEGYALIPGADRPRRRWPWPAASWTRPWPGPRPGATTSRAANPAGLRPVRQDAVARRAGHPPARARRARPCPRPVPAQRPGRHRHRPGRARAGPAPRRRHLPRAPTARRAGGERHVAARRLHRGERRHPDRARQPPVGRRTPGPRDTRPSRSRWRPGSALIYLGSVWHGGRRQPHRPARLGVVLHYAVGWLRPVENHVLAVPPDRGAVAARPGCRSCSATTSTRRSSATSTAGIRPSSWPRRVTPADPPRSHLSGSRSATALRAPQPRPRDDRAGGGPTCHALRDGSRHGGTCIDQRREARYCLPLPCSSSAAP